MTAGLLVALALAATDTPLSAALVVLSPERGPAASREVVTQRFRLVDSDDVRAVLEGAQREVAPEESAREAQRTLGASLRRFDFESAHAWLERAWAAAREVRPSAEGRALVLELCVLQAQLAVLTNDESLLTSAAAFSLTVDSKWVPDARIAPVVRTRLNDERARVRGLPATQRRVGAVPASAKLLLDGTEWALGSVPTPPPGAVVWVTAAGHASAMTRLTQRSTDLQLEPESRGRRLFPLVAAVRAARAEAQRAAAVALGKELGVEVMLLDDGQAVREVVVNEATTVVTPKANWLADGFGGALAIGGGLLSGAAVALFVVGERAALTARSATTLGDFTTASRLSNDTRAVGVGLLVGAGVAFAASFIRYGWVFNRQLEVKVAVFGPGQVTVVGRF